MTLLDPKLLLRYIGEQIPGDLHRHVLIIGSLAAAYHFRDRLLLEGVNTKDADVVVQPAGALDQCRQIAERLLASGWSRKDNCYPGRGDTPIEELRVVRLRPPGDGPYFLELLTLPVTPSAELKGMIKMQLSDGWYVVPTFRFLPFVKHGQQTTDGGLAYAHPAMMALANLLSHKTVGTSVVSEPIEGRRVLRSAKDLGRVLALAQLAGREETESWPMRWESALRAEFPSEATDLAAEAGAGLSALIDDDAAMEDARHAVDVGLLSGRRITVDQLRAIARRLLVDAIDPLAERLTQTT